MSVYIYKGGLKTVEKSGVGKAVLHQEEALAEAGVPMAGKWSEASVVHINTVFPDSVAAAVLARMQGKKVVYYGHSTKEDFRCSFRGSNLLAPLFQKWICFCYQLGDVIVTPTEYSKGLLLQYGIKKPIYSVSNGIDMEQYGSPVQNRQKMREKYGVRPEEKVVISVGHFMERKGILDFLLLAERMPTVRFIWFGHTDPKLVPKPVKKAMREAPKNVTFAGFVPTEELRDAYCMADAFVFLSHEETEGIVVLEALACRTPTLLRRIPVYEGWLTEGRDVYKAQGLPEFQTKLWDMLEGKLPDLTENGRNVCGERSFLEVGKRIAGIYEVEWGGNSNFILNDKSSGAVI